MNGDQSQSRVVTRPQISSQNWILISMSLWNTMPWAGHTGSKGKDDQRWYNLEMLGPRNMQIRTMYLVHARLLFAHTNKCTDLKQYDSILTIH